MAPGPENLSLHEVDFPLTAGGSIRRQPSLLQGDSARFRPSAVMSSSVIETRLPHGCESNLAGI